MYGVSNPHDAAARNYVSKVKKYVQRGGDVRTKDKFGDTPLHKACACIHDNGEATKAKTRTGWGKLRRWRRRDKKKLATHCRHGASSALEMLEVLVSAGSDINCQNMVGDTPLHQAALNGHELAVNYLIGAGADVNIRNQFAKTPLHMACISGVSEVVQKLRQAGPESCAQDKAGETPFEDAFRHHHESIVNYLVEQGENAAEGEERRLLRGLHASSWDSSVSRHLPPFPEGGSHAHAPTASSRKVAAPVGTESDLGGGDGPDTSTIFPNKDGLFPIRKSNSTPRVRTPASSRREDEETILEAATNGSPPAPIMSDRHSRKAPVADGAGAAVVYCAPPFSRTDSATSVEDDGLRGIEALCAFLSAAGAGAKAGPSGVKLVERAEGGSPVRLTSWVKLSDTSSIKRPATANSQGVVLFSNSEEDDDSQESVVFPDSETDDDQASGDVSQSSAASTTSGGMGYLPAVGAASSVVSHERSPAMWYTFQADALGRGNTCLIKEDADTGGSEDEKDNGQTDLPYEADLEGSASLTESAALEEEWEGEWEWEGTRCTDEEYKARSSAGAGKDSGREEQKDGDDNDLPHKGEQNPGVAAVAGKSVAVESSKLSWFRRVGKNMTRASSWARNLFPARPERVDMEAASPECMRTRRARMREDRARERWTQGCITGVGPIHADIHGNSRYY